MWSNLWDKIFKENEWGKYPPEELIRFIARNFYKCENRKPVKILEVGSGTGANIWYLAREGFDVTGVEGSRVGVERTIERLKEESLIATIKVADIGNLPFSDNVFDCVIDIACIYANSYKDSKLIIDEVYRVLKSGGKFFSKTFATGTTGEKTGKKLEGEENTYLEIYEGGLRKDCGMIRLTSEQEIYNLYGRFNIETIDYQIRSEKNREYEIKEWIIVCSK